MHTGIPQELLPNQAVGQGRLAPRVKPSTSQLDGAMSSHASAIDKLEMSINKLLEQLHPVLQDRGLAANPQNVGEINDTAPRAPLINGLSAHTNRLRSLISTVESIQDGLVL